MSIIITSIIPIVLLLIAGNLIRRRDFLPTDFWDGSDKLTYFVLFPALLINKISTVELDNINIFRTITFLILFFIFTTFSSYFIYIISKCKENQFSSIFQSIGRFNSYIYFSIILAVWGEESLSIAAIIAGLIIPLANIFCITSFSFGKENLEITKIIKSIIKNPFIISIIIGFVINKYPVLLPDFMYISLSILASAALPLALLSVGASVQINHLLKKHNDFSLISIWLSILFRLIISPLFTLIVTNLLGLSTEVIQILVIFAAVPTATSAYILAKQMGGDYKFMVATISFQTVLSAITLSIWILYLVKL